MFKVFQLFVILGFSSTLTAQDKPAYKLFDSKGNALAYSSVIDSLSNHADVVLFGELHNNPIAHWLELEVTQDLTNTNSLILGAEMLETDNQEVLDLYLKDSISYKDLNAKARLWTNHKTDYQPLIDFARTNKLNFIATNVPRRYASLVHQKGFDALDSLATEEYKWIAPLPIKFDPDLPRYQAILEMMGDHGSPRLVMAQALKDATMAHSILQNYEEGKQFIHYNGAFHSDFHEGILWYLKLERPDLKYLSLTTVSQKQLDSLESEYLNQADFIIVVDEDMTPTY